jgi:hypothetical protein
MNYWPKIGGLSYVSLSGSTGSNGILQVTRSAHVTTARHSMTGLASNILQGIYAARCLTCLVLFLTVLLQRTNYVISLGRVLEKLLVTQLAIHTLL